MAESQFYQQFNNLIKNNLMKTTNEKMRPQGSVIEPVKANEVTATSGYDGHFPVQFSDESDGTFAARVAMFEGSLASARQNQAGGASLEEAKASLKAKYDAEVLSVEAFYASRIKTVNGKVVK